VHEMAGFFGPAQPGRQRRHRRSRHREGGRASHDLSRPARGPARAIPAEGTGGGTSSLLWSALPVSLSLLCYGEPGAAGFVTPDPVPRPRCSVLCYAAAWARARGLRTSGAHLGVCVRVEPWHWSLSSPPAPPIWGGSHGPDGYATLRRARGPAEWRGGRDAVPEGRGGRASSVSTRRVCGC
jgi:hypothetical protein